MCSRGVLLAELTAQLYTLTHTHPHSHTHPPTHAHIHPYSHTYPHKHSHTHTHSTFLQLSFLLEWYLLLLKYYLFQLKPYSPEILDLPEDEDGLIPDTLDSLLGERLKRGLKMPKVLYIIPTGNNPTGTVIPEERRRQIYEMACRYDFLILEDDPYMFLNYSEVRFKTPNLTLNVDVHFKKPHNGRFKNCTMGH